MLFKHESLPPKAAKIGTLCITPGFQAHLRRRDIGTLRSDMSSLEGDGMIINTAVKLAMSAACLATIATTPAVTRRRRDGPSR